jgi:ferric-dicitrate binding protein FerR (iron transport regulator)
MTGFTAYPRTCERARMWASLQLDGELSELERALLDAHLARCEACAVFVREVEGATQQLRTAELERLPHPIALPSRRRSLRPVHVSAAAALLAMAIGLGALASSFGSAGSRVAPVHAANELNPVTGGENSLIREIRLARIDRERARDRVPQRGLGIPV